MYLGGLVVLAAVIIVLVMRPNPTATPTANSNDPSQIVITTEDGINLATTVKYPVQNSLSPAVVLLHQYGQDRHQWDEYFQGFTDAGIAVLSYDMRGFGDSRLPEIPRDQNTHLASLRLDLPAVLGYLRQQPNIDSSRISLIGASIGADVAYLGSGSNSGVFRAVLLSPVARGKIFDGHDIPSFSSSGVFGISSEKESADLVTFMKTVKEPKAQKIETGNAHGVALLTKAGLLDSIITWVKP